MAKTRKAYYSSRKNPFLWLSLALVIASCVWSVLYSGTEYGSGLWFGTILPIAGAVWYTLVLLIGCEKQIYKIALPSGFALIVIALRVMNSTRSYPACYVALYLLVAVIFFWMMSGKGLGRKCLAGAFAIPLIAIICEMKMMERSLILVLPEILLFAGLIALMFALRIRPNDGTYYPTWGDRVDGRKVRSMEPYNYMIPYIMKTRNTSSNFIIDSVECSKMDAYIRRKRKEGLSGFGITHVLIAAYVRAISQYPGLNRFCSGQKIYTRVNDIQINMAIKKSMDIDSTDTTVKMFFKPDYTAEQVYEEVARHYAEAKKPTLDSGFDNLARALNYIPGLLLRFVVALLQFLDYFGLLPMWLMKLSPFHGSMFITSMASLGIPPIYHHLYDFGNVPLFLAFGVKRRENEVVDDGKVVKRQYIDYTFVTDERICDGFYYASGLKYMKKILANPECLDYPPEQVVQDID